MRKTLYLSILAIGVVGSSAAFADDLYAGAALSKTYSTNLNLANESGSANFSSDNHPVPFKVYGGYNFTDSFSAELGYKNFGTSTIDPVPGSGDTMSTHSHSIYLAGKETWALNESWELFGKLGVARTSTEFSGTSDLSIFSSSSSKTCLYGGIGAAYDINKNLALTLEYEDFGNAKTKNDSFGTAGFSVGIRYNF